MSDKWSFRKILKSEEGQAAVEYAMLAGVLILTAGILTELRIADNGQTLFSALKGIYIDVTSMMALPIP
jgi:Flp pilus assembly pilin Flp